MDIDIKNECRKYMIQFRNWIESRYITYIKMFAVFEENNYVLLQVEINMKKKDYQKAGMAILKYLAKTFKYPNYMNINWRYDINMFKITAICGDINMSEPQNKS